MAKKAAKKTSRKPASASASTAFNPAEDAAVTREFKKLVNMSGKQIQAWLDHSESKEVGFTYEGAKESVGRGSARKIMKLLEKSREEMTAADLKHVHKVVGYIKRHLAQKPEGGREKIKESPWRYSLMNWGHDPLKKS